MAHTAKWQSTLDFASTGEDFGLFSQSHKKGKDNELDNEIHEWAAPMYRRGD